MPAHVNPNKDKEAASQKAPTLYVRVGRNKLRAEGRQEAQRRQRAAFIAYRNAQFDEPGL